MRHTNGIDNLIKDFTHAVRTLRRSPIFATTAAVTLALGIGASTAIFSVTNAVLLRPLPYRNPDRLVLVFWENRPGNSRNFLYSNADFFDLRAGAGAVFDDIGGVASFRAFVPREDGSTEQIGKALVTTNFFRLMGAKIVFGRDFTEADAVPQPASPGVLIPPGSAAILSYEYWQRRYGGSTAVLGRGMSGSGQRGPRIVGVVAPGFKLFFPPGARTDAAPDFWVANNIGYDTAHRNLLTVGAIGRLKSGVTLRRAQERLDALAPELRKNSFDPTAALRLEPMRQYLVEDVRPAILALMGAVIFLLLIACANVANLLLVRASFRERELAVRAALGGSWWRLVSQMLAEALLLSGLGTLLGVVFAWIGIHVLVGVAPATLPRIESTAIDWRVLTFAATAGLAAVAFFGAMPAMRAAKPDVNLVLRGGRAAGLRAGHLLRDAVVVAEVALSFVLLIGSGLMFRSFLELRRVDPGYDPHGLLTFFVTRDWELTRQQGRLELLRELRARLQALPGVENVTAALVLPLGGGARPRNPAMTQPRPAVASAEGADMQQVMPGYFETLRTPLLAGRTFTEEDNAPGRNVVVVDQLFAANAFPNESAVGKRILLPDPATPWAEVIGVVAPQRLFSLSDPGRETAQNIARAYELRDRVGDRENYFITFNYHRQVHRNLELARQTAESWARKYPGDYMPHGFLSGFTSPGTGHYERAAEEGQKAIELNPRFSIGYSNAAFAYIYLNRLSEAEALLRKASELKIEAIELSLCRYFIAFLRSDQAAMEMEMTQRKAKLEAEGWFEHQEALTLAYEGRLKEANRLSERAVRSEENTSELQ